MRNTIKELFAGQPFLTPRKFVSDRYIAPVPCLMATNDQPFPMEETLWSSRITRYCVKSCEELFTEKTHSMRLHPMCWPIILSRISINLNPRAFARYGNQKKRCVLIGILVRFKCNVFVFYKCNQPRARAATFWIYLRILYAVDRIWWRDTRRNSYRLVGGQSIGLSTNFFAARSNVPCSFVIASHTNHITYDGTKTATNLLIIKKIKKSQYTISI